MTGGTKPMYQHLKEYLHSASLSQKAVALGAGLTESALSRMLSGQRRMSIDQYEKICRAMNADPSSFWKIENEGSYIGKER